MSNPTNPAGAYLLVAGPFAEIETWFMAKARENWPLYHDGKLPEHFVVVIAGASQGLLFVRQPWQSPAFANFEPIPQVMWDAILASGGDPEKFPALPPYVLACHRLPYDILPQSCKDWLVPPLEVS